MIHVNAQRPFIEIDGTRYTLDWKRASLAEMLLNADGKTVAFERITTRLKTSKGAVQVYAHGLRKIFEQHGHALVNEFGRGYRLERSAAGERAIGTESSIAA
jgi:DNA-binding response OmpR family regulator